MTYEFPFLLYYIIITVKIEIGKWFLHVIYICFPYTFSLHMYARSYENDIAVIKLRQSSSKYQNVNFANSHYIWPICMPPIDTNWENYNGVVIGTFLILFTSILFYFYWTLEFIAFCLLLRIHSHYSGWGTQFYTGPISPVLMKVEVPIWNNQACQDVYTANKIYDTVMCAGSPAGGKDACQVSYKRIVFPFLCKNNRLKRFAGR